MRPNRLAVLCAVGMIACSREPAETWGFVATTNAGDDGDPEWSNDGTRIIFDRDVPVGDKFVPQLYLMNPDGSDVRALTSLPSSSSHAAWSPVR